MYTNKNNKFTNNIIMRETQIDGQRPCDDRVMNSDVMLHGKYKFFERITYG